MYNWILNIIVLHIIGIEFYMDLSKFFISCFFCLVLCLWISILVLCICDFFVFYCYMLFHYVIIWFPNVINKHFQHFQVCNWRKHCCDYFCSYFPVHINKRCTWKFPDGDLAESVYECLVSLENVKKFFSKIV